MVSLSRIFNVVLSAMILGGSAFWSWNYWSTEYQAPAKYLSIAVLTRTIAPGGTIVVRISSDRRRSCSGHTDRFILKLDTINSGEESVYSDTVRTIPDIGESVNIISRLKLPDDITPGTYIYRAFTHFDCDGRKWRIAVPEASFRVCATPTCGD